MVRSCLRVTVATLLAVGLTTCTDAPTAQRKARAQFALGVHLTPEAQQIASSLPEFGMAIDRVHIVVTRPPSEIVKDTTISFPANQNELSITLDVPIDASQETLSVRVELLEGSLALFGGSQSVVVNEGQTTPPVDIPLIYIGPGASARSLQVTPPTGVITLTGSKLFTAVARDANQAVVPDLPVNWTSSDVSIAIVASNGQATAATNIGQVTLTARGLNGLQATAALTVIGLPSRFATPTGGGQTGTVNTTLPTPFQVVLQTSNGTPVPGATIAFQSLTPGGSVGTASVTTDDQGRASTTIKFGTASGPYTFQASLTGSTAVTPATISATATAGSATQLVLVSGPSSPTASGAPFTVQPLLQRRDQFGNLVQVGDVQVTASVPATHALVGGATVSTTAGGVAQFSDLGVSGPAGPVVVTFTAGALTTSANVTVSAGQPARIDAFDVATTISVPAGAAVPTNQLPAVLVRDASNNPVPGVSITVTASAGTITVPQGGPFTDANGVLKLTSWTLPTTVGSATVSFVLTNVTGSPVVFTANIVAGGVATLSKSAGDAQTGIVNTALANQLAVLARDQFGNPVPNAQVTFTPGANSGAVGDGVTFGATFSAQTDVNGVARATWRLGTIAGQNTLDASSAGASNVSFTATASPGAAAKLAVLTPPNSPTQSGVVFSTQPVVQRQDQFNNPVPGTVTITASVPNGFALVGGTANTNAAGTATFAALAVSGPVGPVTITFGATGVTPATANVTITSGQVASIAASSATTLTGVVNTLVGTGNLPAVVVRDGAGNPVANVTVTFAVNGGTITTPSGSAPPTASVAATTDANGVARLTSWQLPTVVGTATVTATLSGATGSPVSFTATVTHGAAAKLVLVTPPNSPTGSGAAFTTQPSLQIRDQFDNPFAEASLAVTASVPGTHSLVGTTAALTNGSGVATFTNLGVAGTAAQVTITFGVASTSLSTTATVQVVAGTAGSIAASTPTAIDGVAGSPVIAGQVPAVIVRDGAGNVVPNVSVTFAVNGGTITAVGSSTPQSPITAVTDANGIARIGSWTAPTTVGTATVTATLAGANGSPVTFVLTVSNGSAARLVVLTPPNSPTASGAAFTTQPAVQVQDQFGNAFPVSGINVAASVAPVGYTLAGGGALTNALGVATYSTLGVTGPTGTATITFSVASLGLTTTAQVNVIQPSVSFATASQSANEGTTATITAQLSSAPALPVTIPYTLTGTATNGADYTITASPLVIPAGSTSGSVSVTIASDGVAETDETVIVTLGTPTNATLGATTVHTLTISGQTPSVSWTAASQTANEGSTATITAQLSSPSTQTVTVPFTVGGSASNPADYTITASPLTIAAGATTASITVTIASDATAEQNETVVITMGTPTNANPAAPTVHTLTIAGQTPNVSFTAAAQTVNEGGTATITAQLSSPSTLPVTVPFTVTGSATLTSDFTITASPLTIAAGATTASITVNVATDGTAEADETVIVTMGTPANANAAAPTVHTLTINGQTPSVTWTTAAINASEGATTTVTAQLSQPSTQAVTVPFTVTGTAVSPADYTITASPITIPAGSTSANITITSVQDGVAEPDETVIVTMGTPANATAGATTVHTLTIVAQTATVSWTAASQSANEGTTATITAQLSSPSSQAVTVPFSVSATSTATSPADFTIPTTSPLTIPAGSTTAAITVNLVADGVAEPNETVIVTMGTPTNAIATQPTTHTLTIAGQTPTVSWTAASQSVGEGVGTATITASLSQPSTQAVTVPFTVTGTASNPADFTITASPITIPAGSTTANVTVTIVNDGVAEPDESVILSMGTPSNATTGATPVHTLTILGQSAAVNWSAASQTANEGTTATITAQLSSPSTQTVTVPFSVTGGTAASPADFTIPTTSPLTIPAGSTTASITVNLVADGVAEPDETIIVTMGAPTNATSGAVTVHTLTIAGQTPNVSWTAASQTANEGTAATITAQLSQPSTQAVTVPFTVTGTANPSGLTPDYTITASPITIPAGSTMASVTVNIANDGVAEPNETVIVTMGTPANANAVNPTVHTLTIAAQAANVSWTAASQTANEGGSVTITAQLSGPVSQDVTVPFTVTGTATNGVDYTITTSPLLILAGNTSATATVSVATDGIAEADETIIVTMGTPTNATATAPTTHTITIPGQTPSVSFTAAAQTASEGSTATITAQLSQPSTQAVTVPFTLTGTAVSPADYTITASPITIPAGSTSASITVTVAADQIAEPNETVVVTMGTPTNANAVAPTVHTLTIAGQTPNVSWTLASQSTGENSSATITAQLSSVSTQDVTVPYTVSGTATLNSDFTISASPLVIPAGSTTGTVTVNGVLDQIAEPNETVVVTMGAPTNAIAVAPSVHTVTILGQTPTVGWVSAIRTVNETAGTVQLDLILSSPSTQDVTVPFTVNANSTASSPADFTISASPIVIPAGSTTAAVAVNVVNDGVAEPDEVVIVTLGTPTNALLLPPSSFALTIAGQTPNVSWSVASQIVAENVGTATITARLSTPSTQAVTVPFAVSGTANNPADYTITASPLTIPAGSTTASATVTVVNDAVAEPDETVIVTMGTPTNATTAAPTVHTLTIAAQTPTVAWTQASQTSNEGTAATITAQLSSASTQAVTVPFTVTGTAANPADYTITASPLTIPAGSTTATITVNIVADQVAEPNETVVVTMGTPTNATAGTPSVHTLTILGQTPNVSWSAATQSVLEAVGTATVTAVLSQPSTQAVTVPFTLSGTASNPADYTVTASPLTIPAGSTSASATVTIVNDGVAEPDETVILTMGTPTNATTGSTPVHTLTILGQTTVVSWTVAAQNVNEGSPATITAQVSQPSTQAVTVPYTLSGTAANPADYTITASPLTIPAGSTSASITVSTVADAVAEPNETVIVTMGTPTNAVLGQIPVHTVTILAQTPQVRFAVANDATNESVGVDTVVVQLSTASTQTVTVPFTLGGTANAPGTPADYSITASPITFAPGQTVAAIVVSLVADLTAEGNETIIMTLGTPTNATLGTPNVHTTTISDAFRLLIGGTGGLLGTLTSSPGTINCQVQAAGNTGICQNLFLVGTQVTVTATPAIGNVQQAWADACVQFPVGQPCVVTMNTNLTATAHFTGTSKTINIQSNPQSAAMGNVNSQPGLVPAISCRVFPVDLSGACGGTYAGGTPVTLTATGDPNAGSFFIDWSGGTCSGTNPVCVTPNPATGTLTVIPRFGFDPCLQVSSIGIGGASIPGILTVSDCLFATGKRQDKYSITTASGTTLFSAVMGGTTFPPEMHTIVGNFWFVSSSASPISQFYMVPPGTYTLEVLNRDVNNFGAYTLQTTNFTANGFPTQCNHIRTTFGVNVTTGLQLANGDCAYIASNRAVTSPADAYAIFVPQGKTLRMTVSTFTGIAPLIEFRDGFDDNASFTSTLFATSVSQTGGTVTLSMVGPSGGQYVKAWVTGRAAGTTGGYTLTIDP